MSTIVTRELTKTYGKRVTALSQLTVDVPLGVTGLDHNDTPRLARGCRCPAPAPPDHYVPATIQSSTGVLCR